MVHGHKHRAKHLGILKSLPNAKPVPVVHKPSLADRIEDAKANVQTLEIYVTTCATATTRERDVAKKQLERVRRRYHDLLNLEYHQGTHND